MSDTSAPVLAPTKRPHRRSPEAPPCRNDDGQVGGVEVLPLGVLVFVIGGLLITNAWGVIDAKFATDAAAHAAVRSFVEAHDEASAQRQAISSAIEAAEGHGRSRQRIRIELRTDRGFRRCARVQATVRYEVPALFLPWIGGFGNAFQISSVRSELVDPYRSGLPGVVTC
ncbi:MAG: hypothetical protein N2037_01060 [Acidimicrobiales bacterium]|nr:hypothetical protein [Acidimicrobiales bacterium]